MKLYVIRHGKTSTNIHHQVNGRKDSKLTIIGKLQGEVTGTATPKIHLSENADYGGASKELYGHVKLVDTMPETPEPSSDNTDKNNTTVPGLAASPYLVFNYVKASKIKVNAIDA